MKIRSCGLLEFTNVWHTVVDYADVARVLDACLCATKFAS